MDTDVQPAFDLAALRFEEILGYAPGQRITSSEDVARVMHWLAERRPEQCLLDEYGRSVQGRPLQLLTVASPANRKRLADIQSANRAVCRAEPVPDDLPATVWVIANVHGDEHSTAEAALLLAIYLSESDDPVLGNVIVGIDPLQNPDGRARSVNAFYSLFGVVPRTDRNAAEHDDWWPGGRGNHYFFDMNRDWFPLTQPESRARVSTFLHWRPQIVADLHEMWSDSRFFFPPPARPLNPNLGQHIIEWWQSLGRDLGRTFDANGWDYWTAETFDAFYPGYGEAFPCMHGSIGMTFEQASSAGLAVDRKDGTQVGFRETILHHFGAALSVCRSASAGRERLLSDAQHYFESASAIAEGDPVAYVFPSAGPGSPAENVADVLSRQGIEVQRDADGAVVVRLDQTESRGARSILEPETEIDPDWLAEQVRREAENAYPEFYDHTAWSLPLAYGAPMEAVAEVPSSLTPWTFNRVSGTGSAPEYGFLIPPGGMAALQVTSALVAQGTRVHVARKPFSTGGVDYPRGTVLVRKPDQSEAWKSISEAVWTAANQAGSPLTAVAESWTDTGINLGSDELAFVPPPRIAVLFGPPVSTLSYGWIAHLFEQRLRYPFTPIYPHTMADTDLRDYDVIVLPHGSSDRYDAVLTEGFAKKLMAWVEQGGTLVAIRGAAKNLIKRGKDWTSCRVVSDLRLAAEPPSAKPADAAAEEPIPREFRPVNVTGAVLNVTLDRHHWATMGYGASSHVIYTGDLLLTPSIDGRNVARFAEETDLIKAGFVWERMRTALPGKAYLVDETHGRGHVLLFADDPNQRGYWDVTSRMFVQAVLYAKAMSA